MAFIGAQCKKGALPDRYARRLKRNNLVGVVCALWMLGALNAHADLLFDNTGPEPFTPIGAYEALGRDSISRTIWWATSFTTNLAPGQTVPLGSLELPLIHASGAESSTLQFYSDAGNGPATLLEEWVLTGLPREEPVPNWRPTFSRFVSKTPLLLTSDTTYWVALIATDSTTQTRWYYDGYRSAPVWQSRSFSWYEHDSNAPQPALRVFSAVPSPGAVWVAACGVLYMGSTLLQRNKKSA